VSADSGLISGTKATAAEQFKTQGFDFFIDFEELAFNPKENFLGGGVYGDVYIGKWLGASVAIKQFNKR